MEAINPLFTLTISEFQAIVRELIVEALQGVKPLKAEAAKYLTRLEACKALKISLPTLSRYSELGLIPAKRIGNRILYSEEDLKEALKEIPTNKFSK
jgi:excisionase family DNA binding protein